METDTVVTMITIVGSVLGSTLTTITLLLRQTHHMEARIESRIGTLDTRVTDLDEKFTGKIDALDKKFSDKLDVMGRDVADVRERTARLEGHLMAPEGFSPRPPPTELDDAGERQAG